MPKVKEVYQKAVSEGRKFNVRSQDIRAALAYLQNYAEPIDVVIRGEEEVKDPEAFLAAFEKLKKNEPVEYVIHQADFLGQKLYVDERVLIPRQETAELVAKFTERVSSFFDPRNYLVVADIGTGSGCVGVKALLPEMADHRKRHLFRRLGGCEKEFPRLRGQYQYSSRFGLGALHRSEDEPRHHRKQPALYQESRRSTGLRPRFRAGSRSLSRRREFCL